MHLELWINAIFGCVRFGVWLIRFDGNLVMANWGWGVHASNFKGWFLYKKLSGSKVIDNKSSYRYNLFFLNCDFHDWKTNFSSMKFFSPFWSEAFNFKYKFTFFVTLIIIFCVLIHPANICIAFFAENLRQLIKLFGSSIFYLVGLYALLLTSHALLARPKLHF